MAESSAGYTWKYTTGTTTSNNQQMVGANPLRVGIFFQPTQGNLELASNPGLLSSTGGSIFYENKIAGTLLTWDQHGPWVQGPWWNLQAVGYGWSVTEILMVPTNPLASLLVAAAAQYSVKEYNYNLGTTAAKVIGANPNRVSLSFSAQFALLFLGTVDQKPTSSSGSIMLSTTPSLFTMTFADWGPIIQAEWWAAFSTAPPNGLGVTEVVYLPTG